MEDTDRYRCLWASPPVFSYPTTLREWGYIWADLWSIGSQLQPFPLLLDLLHDVEDLVDTLIT
jgi:hypothetical protein